MQKKIEKILSKAAEDEKQELEIHQIAIKYNREAYQKDATEKNKRNWDAARNGLADFVERLWEKYFSRQPAFKSRMEALKWLQEEGYKIKKSKFYKDADIGMPAVQTDGSVLAADIKAYAATLNKVKNKSGELDPDFKSKTKKENRKLDLQNQKYEFELARDMGKYNRKIDTRTEFAVKIGALEAGLQHWAAVNAVDWIHATGGRPEKYRIFINLFNAGLDDLLNEFGDMEDIRIIIKKQDTGNAPNPATNT